MRDGTAVGWARRTAGLTRRKVGWVHRRAAAVAGDGTGRGPDDRARLRRPPPQTRRGHGAATGGSSRVTVRGCGAAGVGAATKACCPPTSSPGSRARPAARRGPQAFPARTPAPARRQGRGWGRPRGPRGRGPTTPRSHPGAARTGAPCRPTPARWWPLRARFATAARRGLPGRRAAATPWPCGPRCGPGPTTRAPGCRRCAPRRGSARPPPRGGPPRPGCCRPATRRVLSAWGAGALWRQLAPTLHAALGRLRYGR